LYRIENIEISKKLKKLKKLKKYLNNIIIKFILIKILNIQGFSGSFLVAVKFFKKPPEILRGGKYIKLVL
jgi:hypothetical protein